MSRKLAWLLLLLLAFGGVAQAAPEAVVPTAAKYAVRDVDRLESVLPQPLDLVRLAEEDTARDRRGLPPRFAVPERVSITPANHGTWEDLGDGQMLWRLRIFGREGTTSLNLGFTRFKMSKGSACCCTRRTASRSRGPSPPRTTRSTDSSGRPS